jgi:hypothetical protein
VVFVLALLVAFTFRFWMPIASPNPRIDVFAMGQQSAEHVLEGKNPYATPVRVDPEGRTDRRSTLDGYVYPPGALFVQTLAYAAVRDVRYGSVLAEAVVAFALWRLARKRWREPTAELIALLFLYFPRGLFVLEQAWTDTIVLMFFALFLILRDSGKYSGGAAVFGLMVSVKQYMVLALTHFTVLEKRWRPVAISLGALVLATVPFALFDARSFLRNGILFVGQRPIDDLSLTTSALLARSYGVALPAWWSVCIGVFLTVVTLVLQRRMDPVLGFNYSLAITYFGMFLFGAAAFCNWYYLVAGFVLFTLVMSGSGGHGLPSAPEPH